MHDLNINKNSAHANEPGVICLYAKFHRALVPKEV